MSEVGFSANVNLFHRNFSSGIPVGIRVTTLRGFDIRDDLDPNQSSESPISYSDVCQISDRRSPALHSISSLD
jgi:hypothetical protein